MYSLNSQTGCVHWFYQATSGVRAGIVSAQVPPRTVAIFGDLGGVLHAVDAGTGQPIWKTKVDDFPLARLTGSPAFYNGRIYAGVASGEEVAASAPGYQCCKFRGSLVALDASTGKQVWKTYTIDPPRATKKNKSGVQLWGPSGAPIWSSPDRSQAQGHLRHHGRQLQRPGLAHQRRVYRNGSRDRQNSLVAPDDAQGRLHTILPPA